MEPHLFVDSWKRIDRAIAHGKAFKSEWERVVNPESYTTSISVDSDWTHGSIKSVTNIVSENDMALELGEFFYQLRAALDAAVYQVSVMEQGCEPPANENRVEFPICHSPKVFDRNPLNTDPFPQQLRDWIETIQPYNTAKTETMNYSTLNRKLEILHNCARKDRHRRLHLVAAVPTAIDWEFTITGPGRITYETPIQANFLEDECIFLEFGIEGVRSELATNIKLESAISIEVSLNEVPIPAGSNLGTELESIVKAVQFVIEFFESGYVGRFSNYIIPQDGAHTGHEHSHFRRVGRRTSAHS
jgi:hypothetical protein